MAFICRLTCRGRACIVMPSFNYAVTAYPQAGLLAKTGFVDLERIVCGYATRYLDSEITKRGKSLGLLRESPQN